MKALINRLTLALPLLACGFFLVGQDQQATTNFMGGLCAFTGFLVLLMPETEQDTPDWADQ